MGKAVSFTSSKCLDGKRKELAVGFHELSQNRSCHFGDVCDYTRKELGTRGAPAPGKSPANCSQRKAEQATFLCCISLTEGLTDGQLLSS